MTSTTLYTQHPLSAAWPIMSAEDMRALQDSIGNVGVLNPITLYEGMVLDGWNRYTAANAAGMPCPAIELGDTDPCDFSEAMNETRRHATASQRAMAMVTIYNWASAHRPSNNSATKKGVAATQKKAKTTAEMAKKAGVSSTTIKQAKAAVKAGLGEAVKDGTLTVAQADSIAKGKAVKPRSKRKPKSTTDTKSTTTATEAQAPTDYSVIDELHDTISGLQDDLVVANMGDIDPADKVQAAALIAELRQENKNLTIENKALILSRNIYQRENADLRDQINRQRREIDKATGKRTA